MLRLKTSSYEDGQEAKQKTAPFHTAGCDGRWSWLCWSSQPAVSANAAGCVKKGILSQPLPTKNNSRESGLFVMIIHSPL